jgi:hypothetical protein
MESRIIKNILVIGTVFPEPNSSAAGSRMMQIIEAFKTLDVDITFASSASDSDFMVDLADFGVRKKSIKLNDSSFDRFIEELNPDLVLFDRFITEEHFGWRVTENCPNAIKILDTEDLHCLRAGRQKAYKEKRNFELTDLLVEDLAKREMASILRCDLSLIISSFEMKILKEVFKIDDSLLLYLPFMLPKITETEIANWKPFEERKDFVFIGNFLHEPNYQAVLCLKNEVWPILRKEHPKAQMHIYGAYIPDKVLQLKNLHQRFFIKGRADDVNEIMQNARVCLAPLPFGAGLKGKLIDAMRNGTPNVSTSVAAEGMHDALPWSGFIKDDFKDFAFTAASLYDDEEEWKQFINNGVQIINQNFDKDQWFDVFLNEINRVNNNLSKHRRFNFIGNLLNQNQYNASKFMSKWIEEKNSKV